MAVKPMVDPKWSATNNPADNIEPTVSLKNGGVPAGGVWGREFLNWQFFAISQWVDWVRSSALDKDNNLSDLTNAATARTNLGLNNASVTLGANAATATKLATARTINGTSFDGTANITTSNWGTSRTLTIAGSGKSVDGSGNVTWSLTDLKLDADVKSNGWQKLPSGLIIQWGRTTGSEDTWGSRNYPMAFPTGSFAIVASGSAGYTASDTDIQARIYTNSQFQVFNNAYSNREINWIAIGY